MDDCRTLFRKIKSALDDAEKERKKGNLGGASNHYSLAEDLLNENKRYLDYFDDADRATFQDFQILVAKEYEKIVSDFNALKTRTSENNSRDIDSKEDSNPEPDNLNNPARQNNPRNAPSGGGDESNSGNKGNNMADDKINTYAEDFFKRAKRRAEEKKYAEDLSLLTAKPVMYVCNVDEKSAVSGNKYVEMVKEALKDEKTEILIIAAGLEAEIAELESENDRNDFLKDVGLSEPGVNKFIRAAYKLLKLRTFFTMGPKEIRAWTIKEGANARKAAGIVHSDMERGFIRAEVMKYNDFVSLGSEHKCREAGKLHIEGKNYIVEDGDILFIRFNV